jgi:hypothetical protein
MVIVSTSLGFTSESQEVKCPLRVGSGRPATCAVDLKIVSGRWASTSEANQGTRHRH